MPVGMAGLFMASLMGAAMSGLASDLNCLAVVGVEDFYRGLRPAATDRERLRMGKIIVACCGVGVTRNFVESEGSLVFTSLYRRKASRMCGSLVEPPVSSCRYRARERAKGPSLRTIQPYFMELLRRSHPFR